METERFRRCSGARVTGLQSDKAYRESQCNDGALHGADSIDER